MAYMLSPRRPRRPQTHAGVPFFYSNPRPHARTPVRHLARYGANSRPVKHKVGEGRELVRVGRVRGGHAAGGRRVNRRRAGERERERPAGNQGGGS